MASPPATLAFTGARMRLKDWTKRRGLWRPDLARELWRETDGGIFGVCQSCCCSIFTDDFNRADDTDLGADWSEVSGSWSITSNTLRTTSTSAVCVHDTGEGSARLRASVSLRGGTGDFLRVIFGYVDSSNYWFAEVKIGTSSAGRLDIYQRSSGTNTLKVSRTTISIAADTWHSCSVCYTTDGVISAALYPGGGGLHTVAFPASLSTEDIVGVGTGSTASSSVQFDDFTASRVGDNCPECPSPCLGCTDDEGPPAWDITLPTLTDDACSKCDTDYSGQTFRVYYCYNCAWERVLDSCSMGGAFPSLNTVILRLFIDSGIRVGLFRSSAVSSIIPQPCGVRAASINVSEISTVWHITSSFDCAGSNSLPKTIDDSGSPCTSPSGDCIAVPVY